MLDEIKDNVKRRLSSIGLSSESDVRYVITSEILKYHEKHELTNEEKVMIEEELVNEICGYGKIEKYISDNTITEIMINGTESIYIERRGMLEKTKDKLDKTELDILIQKIVLYVNKQVSVANPIVDARLKDGSRVNIVLNPIAMNGPIVTIRKFSNKVLDAKDLIANGTMTEEVADFLKEVVEGKFNVFISGGTGSGKTTLLNILSNFINKKERIITIEDSAELQIHSVNNLVKLEARENNLEGFGEITIRDLIIASLRMRPDRIIVGEVRGKETFDMLQAMNTGHSGSLSTGHANSSRDMLTRLESMILMGFEIPIEAIRRQIASALDIIVHISRNEKGERKIIEVNQILGYEKGNYKINKIFEYRNNQIVKVGALIEK